MSERVPTVNQLRQERDEAVDRIRAAAESIRDDNRRTRRMIRFQIACVVIQVASVVALVWWVR